MYMIVSERTSEVNVWTNLIMNKLINLFIKERHTDLYGIFRSFKAANCFNNATLNQPRQMSKIPVQEFTLPNLVLMLVNRLQKWPTIKLILDQHLVFEKYVSCTETSIVHKPRNTWRRADVV